MNGLREKIEPIANSGMERNEKLQSMITVMATWDNVMGFIERANKSNTCRLVLGGKRLGDEFAGGYFIAPTIYADVVPSDEMFREEVFGPVLTFTKFKTEGEAIRLANDTDLGLAAYVFTQDTMRGNRVSLALEAGTIGLGGYAA